MQSLFGDKINELRYYWFGEFELDGMPLIISRTGWSSELGYEIYLRDGTRGDELWERLMDVGAEFGLQPGHTSAIRRIEAGMLSYHADMDNKTNPYELGLDRLVDLEMAADFVGKAALTKIAAEGVKRKQVGLIIDGEPFDGANTDFWPVFVGFDQVGVVTSAIYSPRLKANIALAMVSIEHSAVDTEAQIVTQFEQRGAKVVAKPFYDPKKSIASSVKL
jgi:aminomethyltransferase